MNASKTIENALGISDLEQLACSVIDSLIDTHACMRDNETTFTRAGKLALIAEIQKRLNNIAERITQEQE